MRLFVVSCAVSLIAVFNSASGDTISLRRDANGKLVKVHRVNPFGSKKTGKNTDVLTDYSGIPYDALLKLGVYDDATIAREKERLMQMNTKEGQKDLEALLYSTDIFAGQVRRARDELAKNPKLNPKMIKYLIRMRVTAQLALMEEKFTQETVERFMVRAILDKERQWQNASKQK